MPEQNTHWQYDDPIDRAARTMLESCALELKCDVVSTSWYWRDRNSTGEWERAPWLLIEVETIRAMRKTGLTLTSERVDMVKRVAACYAADYVMEGQA